MSAERVELVKQGYEAWNRGDRSWVLEHMSPEVEWIPPRNDPYSGTYRGHDGVQEFWSRWRAAVGQLRLTPQEMTEIGDHVLVIALRQEPRDRSRGLRPDRPGLHIRR